MKATTVFLEIHMFSGGTVIVPGSHKHFESTFRDTTMPQIYQLNVIGHFCRVAADNIAMKECEERHQLVCCNAGDLILFDARTIHCNNPAIVDPFVF